MVGPFAQGIFLMGIIYWYSKGLLNLINDYYRSEFNRKLKTTTVDQKKFDLKPQSYDLDDMEELIKMELLKDMEKRSQQQVVGDIDTERDIHMNDNSFCNVDEKEKCWEELCYQPNRKIEFLNIVFKNIYSNRKHIYFSLSYPICLLNEAVT